MKPILEVSDLNKSFGAVTAAADINVTIHENEMVAVIGSNGAGKTTFVNMVTGYLKPTSGRIQFCGKDIAGRAPREISRSGICRSFQVAQLFPEMTILEHMMLAFAALQVGLKNYFYPLHSQAAETRALEVLGDFGIAGHANARVGALAQGVRKLLDIAIAMVSRPQLLLLDEPTSGVAIEEKFALMETVMGGVRQTKAAVMFIEHDMEIVSQYARRVIAFYEGRIIANGPTKEVLAHAQVREFIIGEIQEAAIVASKHD
ncbi:MAG: ABC transporter ATP-binding protein [Betaproteobacteria bacterium]|nr:ABC transporter ATP-binding protein [Betaproteobacteria bacterium]